MIEKEYKIVKIISDTSVVINGGSNESIAKGDKFEIYQKGIEILDPDTNESLGSLDYIKATIVASNVMPKISVCRNSDVRYNPSISDMSRAIGALLVANSPAELLPLNVNPEDISGGFEDIDKTIRIGDLVRLVPVQIKPNKHTDKDETEYS